MARILFATVPVIGHIKPLLSLARAFVSRGHEVTWYCGQKYRELVSSTGASFSAFERARDYDDAKIDVEFPGRATRQGLDQIKYDLKHVFIDAGAGQLADLEPLATAWKPQIVVADPTMLGGLLLQEKRGIPLVTVGIVPFTVRSRDTAPFGLGLPPNATALGRVRNAGLNWAIEHLIFRGVHRHWVKVRARLDLPTPDFFLDAPKRASLFLLPTIPSFEYPRTDLPPNVRFVGILPTTTPKEYPKPDFFSELDGPRPVVHVSQGTIANRRPELFTPAITGLAREEVLVVVATGGRSGAELGLTNLPPNVRMASFLPYSELLPRTAVMLTNGGYGGVQIALSHGVPLVVGGTTEDKPEVAARVAWSGAGVNLRTATPSPEVVRRAVRTVLDQSSFKARAQSLAREYATYDAVTRAVGLIEEKLTASEISVSQAG